MNSQQIQGKKAAINKIIESIFALENPKIEAYRMPQITDFITSSINGDNLVDHLALNVNLGENKRGVIVYILTNLRLIQVNISPNEIQSTSFPLNTIIGIERNLIDGGARAVFGIAFQNGTVGMRYSPKDTYITDFFQKIDQSRPMNG